MGELNIYLLSSLQAQSDRDAQAIHNTLLKAHLANIRSTSGLPKLDPFSLYVGGIGKRRGE